jgi:hypothetical protein
VTTSLWPQLNEVFSGKQPPQESYIIRCFGDRLLPQHQSSKMTTTMLYQHPDYGDGVSLRNVEFYKFPDAPVCPRKLYWFLSWKFQDVVHVRFKAVLSTFSWRNGSNFVLRLFRFYLEYLLRESDCLMHYLKVTWTCTARITAITEKKQNREIFTLLEYCCALRGSLLLTIG